jgi:HAD superfamily hydrolase (TIGR01509 family)
MIRAAIFDFGLVISSPRPPGRFRAYERELGLGEGTINRIMFDSPAWQDALCGRLTMTAYWQAVGPRLGLTTPPAIDAFRRRYYNDEAANEEVLAIVRRLHGDCRLAILSNHPPGLGRWLRDWGIDCLFDVVYCSGDEGHVKPERVVYQTTLERLGVAAGEAVFIDDTPGHVAAARALGIAGIVFTGGQQLGQELNALLDGSAVSRTGKA